MTYAKIIADSVGPDGVRLTTMQVRFHRFVLAEFNTHRVFSRNSASSRAIPLSKQLDHVMKDSADPISWPQEKKGMQGGEEIEHADQIRSMWETARLSAWNKARILGEMGLHKSLANRLLEPFSWHTVVVTATAWENFFEQRCSPMAQPEIRVAAEMMREAMEESTPTPLEPGQWHRPYIRPDDISQVTQEIQVEHENPWRVLNRISAARCARVSYLTQEGVRDLEADLDLYKRLVSARPAHFSPLEHVATPWPENRGEGVVEYPWGSIDYSKRPRVGNLLGWRSLRTELEALMAEEAYR